MVSGFDRSPDPGLPTWLVVYGSTRLPCLQRTLVQITFCPTNLNTYSPPISTSAQSATVFASENDFSELVDALQNAPEDSESRIDVYYTTSTIKSYVVDDIDSGSSVDTGEGDETILELLLMKTEAIKSQLDHDLTKTVIPELARLGHEIARISNKLFPHAPDGGHEGGGHDQGGHDGGGGNKITHIKGLAPEKPGEGVG